ncbi:DUF1572 domain-containing protein [Paenibacillus sp. H1-7]|uniref:DUF1572 family protein n=1 Tax=Paenibacillus sp. H1-7 TaxID=2282849 RepID=UPI001EF91B02|nr:DUF1572 family protein [Paenibacillus sp. H1-7]ULL16155.1 DUF1572 domain-containing protein [Paenibacillus sp. H1-7]
MDISMPVIDSILSKFKADKKWLLQAIEQLTEEDICWSPTNESNSIANLISHIRGTAHARIEILLYEIPDTRDRAKEFEPGLTLSKEQALLKATEAFDIIIAYLEYLKTYPEMLLSQPFLDKPPLTFSAVNNQTTALNLMIQMVREINYHVGQINYIAKMRKGPLVWKYD